MGLQDRRRDRVALSGTGGNNTLVPGTGGDTEQRRQVFGPNTKLACRDAWRVIIEVIENAEHLVGEVFGDGCCHSGETVHEKEGRLLPIKVK